MSLPRRKKLREQSPPIPSSGVGSTVGAAVFKAHCLALMDRVDRTGEEIVVTKHNRPVAKLVPVRNAAAPDRFVGRSRGRIRVVGDLVAPVNEDWEVDEDL